MHKVTSIYVTCHVFTKLMYFQSFTHPSILQLKLDSWGLEPIPATIKKKHVHSGQVANLLQGANTPHPLEYSLLQLPFRNSKYNKSNKWSRVLLKWGSFSYKSVFDFCLLRFLLSMLALANPYRQMMHLGE